MAQLRARLVGRGRFSATCCCSQKCGLLVFRGVFERSEQDSPRVAALGRAAGWYLCCRSRSVPCDLSRPSAVFRIPRKDPPPNLGSGRVPVGEHRRQHPSQVWIGATLRQAGAPLLFAFPYGTAQTIVPLPFAVSGQLRSLWLCSHLLLQQYHIKEANYGVRCKR
jgi:hypothetical protein